MYDMTVNTFSNWLTGVLVNKGWTQAELARRASVSPAAISDVISGRRNVGKDLAVSIAAALRIAPEDVLRAAGILPPEKDKDNTLSRIESLYHALRDKDNKQKALEFMEFLSEQEDKNDRKGKRP